MITEYEGIGLEPVSYSCSLEEELPRVLSVNPDVLKIGNHPVAAFLISLSKEPGDLYL